MYIIKEPPLSSGLKLKSRFFSSQAQKRILISVCILSFNSNATHNEDNTMNITTNAYVNKVFTNTYKDIEFVRVTLAVTDHRGKDLWLTYNVPPKAGADFKAKHPEGSTVTVSGLLYSDSYKGKDGWVNRVGIDVESVEAAS